MGGIATDARGQVCAAGPGGEPEPVPGLFAAGECACSGLHGANRLGSNSLVETLVVGRACGEAAALVAFEKAARAGGGNEIAGGSEAGASAAAPSLFGDFFQSGALPTWANLSGYGISEPLPSTSEPATNSATENPIKETARASACETNVSRETFSVPELRARLGVVLDTHVGIVTSGADLEAAQQGLREIAEQYQALTLSDGAQKFNTEWQQYLELGSLILCAQATVAAGLARLESRGAFQRSDYPDPSPDPKHSYTRLTPTGQLEVTHA
jgi:fumarate reductase flavoprotein subunit